MSARLHTDIEIVSKSNVASSGNKDSSTLSLSAGLFFFDQQATRDDYAFPSSLVPLFQNEWKNKCAKPQPRSQNLHMKTSLIYIKMNLYAEHRVEIKTESARRWNNKWTKT